MSQQTTQPQSPLDSKDVLPFVKALINAGETNNTIADAVRAEFGLVTTDDSVRRFRKRHGIQIPGTNSASTKIEGDNGQCSTPITTSPILDDPDAMLKQRGLDPGQWYIDSLKANQWDGPSSQGNTVTYYQTSFTVRRKRPELILRPVRSDGWSRPPRFRNLDKGYETVVICGDQQAPFHDERLHGLFCRWLEVNRPDRGINLGDLNDFPDISRHPADPENVAYANECLQAGYNIMRGYVEASPDTAWSLIPGNHDERIRQYLLKNAPHLHGLKRVDSPEAQGELVHELTHLMRFDELGVAYVDPQGTYEDAQVELSKNLAVRHGWVVRQGSGASALKTLEQTGYSIIVGHTHRQSIVHHTTHDINRQSSTLLAAETGCMCRIDSKRDSHGRRFPGYMVLPDWQQGFAVATIYDDGKFKVDLGTYVNETLLYRNERYQ